jgi:predicted Rossmann fold flavoprotein
VVYFSPNDMKKYDIVIIGAGASGLVAAISAARKNKTVLICERMPVAGKKILASGGGRCNLANDNIGPSFYNPQAQGLVESIFYQFGKEKIIEFFKDLGLTVYSQDGRIFPVTNQASSVLSVLEIEIKNLAVPVELNFEVSEISKVDGGYAVLAKNGKKVFCGKLLIAGGGRTYPALGSDGSCYDLAAGLGHKIITPMPVSVALTAKDPFCHLLQGQKIFAGVKGIVDGKVVSIADGELIFTKYGLSGTAIIDMSRPVSCAIHRGYGRDIEISVDMAPFMDKDALAAEFKRRLSKGFSREDLFTGILPNKFRIVSKELAGGGDADTIAAVLKDRRFKVSGTRGWNEAEFTDGGVEVSQIKIGTLESAIVKNLYFCGEIIDIKAPRGGYNLAWAWASGFVAGLTR